MQKIDIKLRPSRFFMVFIGLMIAACLAIIVTLPLDKWIKTLLLIVLLRYGWHVLRRFGSLSAKDSVNQLSVDDDGWKLHDQVKVVPGELCGDSTLTFLVCVLRFKSLETGKKKACVVFRDSVIGDDYRRLLVLLRTSHLRKKASISAER